MKIHPKKKPTLVSEEKFPRMYDTQAGQIDGFQDAANLLDHPDSLEGATVRIRTQVAGQLSYGFPYFSGYTRGHELFSDYLGSREK